MKKHALFAATFAALLGACASTPSDIDEVESAGLMSKPQLESALVGNTFPFSKGGMYFASETDATIMWDGQIEEVQWYANDDSEFCYTAVLLGGSEECLGLRSTGTGDYVRIFDGKSLPVKATDIKDGRTF